MSQISKPESASHKADLLRCEAVCDEFEEALLANKRPLLEDYLTKVGDKAQPTLLRELLLIEFHYLDCLGQNPEVDVYGRRFPLHHTLVEELIGNKQLWRKSRTDSADTILHAEKRQRQSPASRSRPIHIRCPHCHEAMDVASDAPLTGVICEICGSQFSLANDECQATQSRLASIGHFELTSRIGVGGFGTIWRAIDTKLDRIVAVKVPRSSTLDEKQEQQLLNEARAAAQLNHPNIVSVHEVGRDNGTVYIVSDLVNGVTLSDWLESRHPARRKCVEVCIQIADALHHAHEAGVIHRDMKASNVLLDQNEQPRITDFGLAKRETVEATIGEDGKVFGTPAYMSPEQARGEGHRADRRTDVYSLGVVLYQLLTEELPFRGNTAVVLHRVLHDEPPSPRRLDDTISRDLDTICLKCLEKDPDKRYPTAKELADDLRRYQRREPIAARPISRAERAWRWCRRHPMSAIAAGLLAVIAVASPIVAIRERLHLLESDNLNMDKSRLIQQLTVDRDGLRRKLDVQTELRPFHGQGISRSRRQVMQLAYDQYQPAIEQMLSAATPEERRLALFGLAILAKDALPPDQALPTLLKARDELESAAKNSADNRQLSAALASCYDSLGDLYGWSDQPALAREYCQRAEKLWNRLAQTEPSLANYDALAENQSNLVRLENDAGSSRLALSRAEPRKPSSQQLHAFFPRSPKLLYETACALANCRPWLTQNQAEANPTAAPSK